MRVLLDEQLPRQLASHVVGYDVRTVQQQSWAGLKNGVLLTVAEAADFAVFVTGDRNLDRADDYGADAILIDSASPGHGEVFDWSLAEGAPAGRRVIMAGGLTPDNVADAIERVNPWGVDVASGVEESPGRKDATKLREFIAAAKGAEPVGYRSDAPGPFDWADDT